MAAMNEVSFHSSMVLKTWGAITEMATPPTAPPAAIIR